MQAYFFFYFTKIFLLLFIFYLSGGKTSQPALVLHGLTEVSCVRCHQHMYIYIYIQQVVLRNPLIQITGHSISEDCFPVTASFLQALSSGCKFSVKSEIVSPSSNIQKKNSKEKRCRNIVIRVQTLLMQGCRVTKLRILEALRQVNLGGKIHVLRSFWGTYL